MRLSTKNGCPKPAGQYVVFAARSAEKEDILSILAAGATLMTGPILSAATEQGLNRFDDSLKEDCTSLYEFEAFTVG